MPARSAAPLPVLPGWRSTSAPAAAARSAVASAEPSSTTSDAFDVAPRAGNDVGYRRRAVVGGDEDGDCGITGSATSANVSTREREAAGSELRVTATRHGPEPSLPPWVHSRERVIAQSRWECSAPPWRARRRAALRRPVVAEVRLSGLRVRAGVVEAGLAAGHRGDPLRAGRHATGAARSRTCSASSATATARRAARAALRMYAEFAHCMTETMEYYGPRPQPIRLDLPQRRPRSPTPCASGAARCWSPATSATGTSPRKTLREYDRPINLVMAREANATTQDYVRDMRERAGVRVIYSDTLGLLGAQHDPRPARRTRSSPSSSTACSASAARAPVPFFGAPAPLPVRPVRPGPARRRAADSGLHPAPRHPPLRGPRSARGTVLSREARDALRARPRHARRRGRVRGGDPRVPQPVVSVRAVLAHAAAPPRVSARRGPTATARCRTAPRRRGVRRGLCAERAHAVLIARRIRRTPRRSIALRAAPAAPATPARIGTKCGQTVIEPINSAVHRHLPRDIKAKDMDAVLAMYAVETGTGLTWSEPTDVVAGFRRAAPALDRPDRRRAVARALREAVRHLRRHRARRGAHPPRLLGPARRRTAIPPTCACSCAAAARDGSRRMLDQRARVWIDQRDGRWVADRRGDHGPRDGQHADARLRRRHRRRRLDDVHDIDGSPPFRLLGDMGTSSGAGRRRRRLRRLRGPRPARAARASRSIATARDGTFTDVTAAMGLPARDRHRRHRPGVLRRRQRRRSRSLGQRHPRPALLPQRRLPRPSPTSPTRPASARAAGRACRSSPTTTATASSTSTSCAWATTSTPRRRPTGTPTTASPDSLYHNNGDGTFTEVSDAAGSRRQRLGPRRRLGRLRQRRLARPLRRQRVRHQRAVPQRARRHVPRGQRRRRRPRAQRGHGRRLGRLRQRRRPRPLRVEHVRQLALGALPPRVARRRCRGTCAGRRAQRVDTIIDELSRGSTLLHNNGDGTFTDVSDAAGIRDAQWGWGAEFLDYNDDGRLDIYNANGMITGPAASTTSEWTCSTASVGAAIRNRRHAVQPGRATA